MNSLLYHISSRFREGLVLTTLLLATAVGFCGCGGSGSTRVSGPEFVGFGSRDPASADIPVPDYRSNLKKGVKGLRIGVVRHFWEEDLRADEEVRGAM